MEIKMSEGVMLVKSRKTQRFAAAIAMASVLSSPTYTYADWWQSTKESVNQAMFWKAENLSEISYSNVYPREFYTKGHFPLIIMGGTVVTAGLVSYFTAGAGAPAAAMGVSTVASTVAGGGAGSYMAGLSIVGGWFGGNAMLGSAILNGISIGTLGGSTAWGALSVGSKLLVLTSASASLLDGIFIISNPNTENLEYRVRIKQPEGIGGRKTRESINKLNNIDRRMLEALQESEKYSKKIESADLDTSVANRIEYEFKYVKANEIYEELVVERQAALNSSLQRLSSSEEQLSQEDLIVLGVLAWNNLEMDLFNHAVSNINPKNTAGDQGFYHYLKALKHLNTGDEESAIKSIDASIKAAPYSLEPALLYLAMLGQNDFARNKPLLDKFVKQVAKDFSDGKYKSDYNLVSLYYRMASIHLNAADYKGALQYFEKSKKQLGLIESFQESGKNIEQMIDLAIANALYLKGNVEKADSAFEKLLSKITDDRIKDNMIAQYAKNLE